MPGSYRSFDFSLLFSFVCLCTRKRHCIRDSHRLLSSLAHPRILHFVSHVLQVGGSIPRPLTDTRFALCRLAQSFPPPHIQPIAVGAGIILLLTVHSICLATVSADSLPDIFRRLSLSIFDIIVLSASVRFLCTHLSPAWCLQQASCLSRTF